ncbi:MAG: transposase [Verrucomicrobiota bacterium]
MLPIRKRLPHTPPPWVPNASLYFITICCQHRHRNTLAKPDIAAPLFETIAYREKLLHWSVHLMLLMPDHLHAFIAFSPHQSMTKTISDWKQYTAKKLKIDWQANYFDHRIRNDAELQEKWSYVLNNPVRANLCQSPEDWPYKR